MENSKQILTEDQELDQPVRPKFRLESLVSLPDCVFYERPKPQGPPPELPKVEDDEDEEWKV